MLKRLGLGIWLPFALCCATLAVAQTAAPTTDILGVHDLSAGSSPLRGPNSSACIYCHVPHGGLSTTPLWNQTLSTKQYTLYPGATANPGTPTAVNSASVLCLSCYDGSVAVGHTVGIGNLQMVGSLASNMGTALEGSHPFSVQPQLQDAPSLIATLVASHMTKDADVKLIGNNVECSTCHDVHNQFKDKRSPKFLVRDN